MKNRYLKFTMFILILIPVLVSCSNEKNDESNQAEAGESDSDELTIAIGEEPESGFDPTTGWGRYGSPLFQSTLFKQDKDFNIVNDIAKDYSVSDDGLEWEVEIEDDITFSNEETLTVEDVIFTYETAKDSGSIVDLNNLQTIEKIDDNKVKFTLKEPQSTFIYLLVSTGIVPEDVYDENYNENPIGSGPFQLEQWDKGQQLIVTENPYYYDEEPSFKKITFLFLDEDTALAAAKAGEVDLAAVPPNLASEEIDNMKLVELDSVDNRGIVFPYVASGEETKDGYPIGNDVTADLAIRKAINVAVDREGLVDNLLDGYGTPSYTGVEKLPWWNSDSEFEDNDKEKAMKILNDAGWKENAEDILEKDGLEASFTLYYPSDDQIRQSLSMTVSEELNSLGFDIKTEGKPWSELETLMYSNPVMMGWGSHDPIEIYNIYSSDTKGIGHYNVNYYGNATVDDHIDDALRSLSEEEANKSWKQAQWDGETGFSAKGDAPWAWLVNVKHLYFVNEDLEIGEQKVQPHGHGWPVTDFITEWHWAK